MKVYVIMKGDYSDKHLCCVTDSEEKAEILKKKFSDKWDEAYWYECDTDEYNLITDEGYSTYECQCIDGAVYVDEVNIGYPDSKKVRHYPESGIYVATVHAKDEAHAKKIFADMVAKCKAEEEGI